MKYDLGEIIPQNVIYIYISFIFKVELLWHFAWSLKNACLPTLLSVIMYETIFICITKYII